MTDATLVELRARKTAAWDALRRWGEINTHAQTATALVEIDLGFRRAQNEFIAASAAYEAALNEALKEKTDGC